MEVVLQCSHRFHGFHVDPLKRSGGLQSLGDAAY